MWNPNPRPGTSSDPRDTRHRAGSERASWRAYARARTFGALVRQGEARALLALRGEAAVCARRHVQRAGLLALLLSLTFVCVSFPLEAYGKKPVEEPLPCADLPAQDKAEYLQLLDHSFDAYQKADYQTTIDSILKLKKICDDDPRLDFNLARAYQRSGGCNMARYWYEGLLANVGNFSVEFMGELPELARQAIIELSSECSLSVRVGFLCSEPDVFLGLSAEDGSLHSFDCPFEGRMDAGKYSLSATKPGMLPVVRELTLVTGVENRIVLPPLDPVEEMGTLVVRCPRGVRKVRLEPRSLDLDCDELVALDAGEWTIGFEIGEFTFVEPVLIEENRDRVLTLTSPAEPEEEVRLEHWAWFSLVSGAAFLTSGGVLFGMAELMTSEGPVATAIDPDTQRVLDYGTAVDERKNGLRLSGAVAGGLGLVGVVTGIVLFSIDEEESTELTLVPESTGGSFVLTSHF